MFGVHMVNVEEQGNQAQIMSEKDPYPIPQVDLRWKRIVRKRKWKWDERALCLEQKDKGNRQGKDPRTFDGNNQGGDLGTPETNSQGEDPRTFEEPVERWRVQKKRKEEM